jgi:hypothetical protein
VFNPSGLFEIVSRSGIYGFLMCRYLNYDQCHLGKDDWNADAILHGGDAGKQFLGF